MLGACTPSETSTPTLSVDIPDVPTGPPTDTTGVPTDSIVRSEPVAYEPVFVTAECAFDAVPDQNPECGYLEVPENRSDPDSGTVRLHVAVFRSTSDSPAPDPVVYLDGGPGGDALETVRFSFEDTFAPFLSERDVILFDQRGTGYSEPSFACEEVEDLTIDYIGDILGADEILRIELEANQACHDRLERKGVDFAGYNSGQSAADVADLRTSLGYDEWNLYGISYGTKLALTVMRDHPEGIRSAVLDSVYPPERDLVTETPANFARALDEFFGACSADTLCSTSYPDLENRFYDLVDQLNTNPINVPVTDSLTLDTYDAAIDGYGLMGTVFQGLYSIDAIRYLPRMITDLESDRSFVVGLLLSNAVTNRRFLSSGYYSAVQCSEEAPFTDEVQARKAVDALPQFGDYFEGSLGVGPATYTGCEIWDTGTPDPIENELVVSDIPTYITTGRYDPITPPSWGLSASDGLSNFFYDEFPVGHAATASDLCAQALMLAFVADPGSEPTDACLADLAPPEFLDPALADAPSNYVEEPVAGLVGVTSVRPDGWEEISDGVWSRGQTDLDTTVLLMLGVANASADLVVGVLASQFGLEVDAPTPYEANGIAWNVYGGVYTGAPVSAAFGDVAGGTMAVIFIHDPAETVWDSVIFEILDRTTG